MSDNQIVISDLSKVYDNGFTALKNINLNIKKGEIFAMLGPNGAGKTTLISIICGVVIPSSGKVLVENYKKILTVMTPVIPHLINECFEINNFDIPIFPDELVNERPDLVNKSVELFISKRDKYNGDINPI